MKKKSSENDIEGWNSVQEQILTKFGLFSILAKGKRAELFLNFWLNIGFGCFGYFYKNWVKGASEGF